MSHLSLPRVHFAGKFTVNHTYLNNNPTYYDAARVKLKSGIPLEGFTIPGENGQPDIVVQDADFSIPNVQIPPGFSGANPPAEFVQLQEWRRRVQRWFFFSEWNYFSNFAVSFDQTTITGVELPTGELITSANRDALVGSSVELLGHKHFERQSHAVMVDLNPYGTSSQIYSGLFRLSKQDNLFLEGGSPNRANSFWLNWVRNTQAGGDIGASAVWQISLPKDQLSFPDSALQQSAALAALQQAANSGQGLVVRFCTYMLAPGTTRRAGRSGPSFLLLVGTIGGWDEAEPTCISTGRLLYPDTSLTVMPLGPAIAKTDHQRRVLTLDLISTFPDAGYLDMTNLSPSDAPPKKSFGTLRVGLRPSGNATAPIIPLGTIAYDEYNTPAYLKRAGIIELPYPDGLDPQMLDQGDIEIFGRPSLPQSTRERVVLSEVRANVFSADRNVYLNVGETATITVQALERGQLPTAPVTISLAEIIELSPPADNRVPAASPVRNLFRLGQDQVTIGTDGKATFTVEGVHPGVRRIEFAPVDRPGLPQGHTLRDTLNFYINVRVLPEDNFDDVDDETIWNDYMYMYRNVFAYYDLFYPVMSRIIDFSNPNIVMSSPNPTLIKTLTAPEAFESTLYMPVSRDMSEGKRKLLFRWCSIAESGGL